MCGISGYFQVDAFTQDQIPRLSEGVLAMNESLRLRGPDADLVKVYDSCILGHRRLGILDLSLRARQPLSNAAGTTHVIVNGEIYNYPELKILLQTKGYVFRTSTDSEVLIHLYDEYGDSFVERLDGMFAFALYDEQKKKVILGRDRTGKKPLFFRIHPSPKKTFCNVVWASELSAIFSFLDKTGEDKPKVRTRSIKSYLSLSYIPEPFTAYSHVFKVPKAHVVILYEKEKEMHVEVKCFWSRSFSPTYEGNIEDAQREIKVLLENAVKRRLMSDVPVGAFLSGGLDSSIVVACMAKMSSSKVKTFSIGFEGEGDLELKYAREVAKRYQTSHHEFIVKPDMALVLSELVRHHGEPFSDSSGVATYYLSKMTKMQVTVALSGDGADEIFAGYKRYGLSRLAYLADKLPPLLRSRWVYALSQVSFFAPQVSRMAKVINQGEALRYLELVSTFGQDELVQIVQKNWKKGARWADGQSVFGLDERAVAGEEVLDGEHPFLESFRYASEPKTLFEHAFETGKGIDWPLKLASVDFMTYLPGDINPKVDVASMAHSLEVRCPFLDTKVIEFASRLPSSYLFRARGKYLLRQAFKNELPFGISRRIKRGFALPLELWMKGSMREQIAEVLTSKRAQERGIFSAEGVSKLLLDVKERGRHVDKVWNLFMLELWYRECVDVQ